MSNLTESINKAWEEITIKAAVNWLLSNLTKLTVLFGILWVIGKPFVDGYIIRAVAEQKYVNEQALESVIDKLDNATNTINTLTDQYKIIHNQNIQHQFKVNEIDRRLDDMNSSQRELNRDMRTILREFRSFSNSNR